MDLMVEITAEAAFNKFIDDELDDAQARQMVTDRNAIGDTGNCHCRVSRLTVCVCVND